MRGAFVRIVLFVGVLLAIGSLRFVQDLFLGAVLDGAEAGLDWRKWIRAFRTNWLALVFLAALFALLFVAETLTRRILDRPDFRTVMVASVGTIVALACLAGVVMLVQVWSGNRAERQKVRKAIVAAKEISNNDVMVRLEKVQVSRVELYILFVVYNVGDKKLFVNEFATCKLYRPLRVIVQEKQCQGGSWNWKYGKRELIAPGDSRQFEFSSEIMCSPGDTCVADELSNLSFDITYVFQPHLPFPTTHRLWLESADLVEPAG